MKFIISILIIFFNLHLFAQNKSLTLSLDEAIEIGIKNNTKIKIIQQEVEKSRAEKNQTNAFFLPSLNVKHNFTRTNSPLMALGIKLDQEIITAEDFMPQKLNSPSLLNNNISTIEIYQPILNMEGWLKHKASKSIVNALKNKQKSTHEYVKLNIKISYNSIVLLKKQIETLSNILESARNNYQTAQNIFKQGYSTKADILAAEVNVLNIETKLNSAKSKLENSKEEFAHFIGLKLNQQIVLSTNLNKANFSKIDNYSIKQRSDIQAFYNKKNAYQQMLNAEKMSYIPTLTGYYKHNTNSNKLFKNTATNYMLGVSLNWNIFSGTSKLSKIKKAKAQYNKIELELDYYVTQNKIKLNNIIREINLSNKKLELLRKSLNQSKESLKIIKNRYKQGLEKTIDLLNSESLYSSKQLEYLNELFNYNSKVYTYQFMTES